MHVGGCYGAGGHDVQADDFISSIEQNHAELFPVGLSVGFDEFADNWCALLRIGQPALFKRNFLVTNQGHSVCRNEFTPLGTFERASKKVLLRWVGRVSFQFITSFQTHKRQPIAGTDCLFVVKLLCSHRP